jgi:chemotaxis protein MotB
MQGRNSTRKRKKPSIHDNNERWLLTYADLITLLLAFFIVMYSMSRIDAKKFGAMSNALSGALSGRDLVLREQAMFSVLDETGRGPLDVGDLRLIESKIKEQVQTSNLGESVSTQVTDRGLVIHIMEGALFEEAKADLTVSAMAVLRTVAEQVKSIPNQVRVEGHTDPRPISTPKFPSNWELSTARATSVLRFLVDSTGVAPDRISALGFGEFRPIAPNDTPENMAQNRRVDIVILARELGLSEPEGTAFTE